MISGTAKTNRRKNAIATILQQVVSTACGIIIPRVMIGAFGSVVYGATVSIAQFVSYIELFEGGIGMVARGALYKSLAARDQKDISSVYQQICTFYRKIGIFFLVYSLFIAIFYHDMAGITAFDRKYTFGLVCVIGLSTLAKYMGGISNMTLLHADQKQYLTHSIIMITNVINTAAIVLLVWVKVDVMTVKLASSLIFVVRPILYSYFVRRDYRLEKTTEKTDALHQKWTGLGQHIAYFLHTNTDIVLLTLFADLKQVAVYSVYNLVIKSIWNIASSFSGGMEAAFGSVLFGKGKSEFKAMFERYKALLTLVTIVMFGTASILLVPFVRLYVGGVSDANYIQPLFGVILLLSEAMNCATLPCSTVPISANRLKQTRWGSYLEAVINITVSCVLIRWNPLLGVALGTFAATVFKCIYYIAYAGKHFIPGTRMTLLKQFVLTMLAILMICVCGTRLLQGVDIENYFVWCLWGCLVAVCTILLGLAVCKILFPNVIGIDVKKMVCRAKHDGK